VRITISATDLTALCAQAARTAGGTKATFTRTTPAEHSAPLDPWT